MSPDLPIPTIPSYKSRRGWLIAFGVLKILIACFFLLLIVGVLVVFPDSPAAAGSPESPPVSPAGIRAFLGILYGGTAIVFLVLGVGSLRCKNWARLATLAVSGFWLAIGILSTVGFYLISPVIRRESRLPPGAEQTVFAGTMAFMIFFFVVMPSVFLLFYSRKSVKATCLARAAQTPRPTAASGTNSSVPVPVIVLAIWEGMGVLVLASFLTAQAAPIFGVILRGWPGFLVLLTSAILSGLAAWLIVRRRFIGWSLALGKAIIWTASAVITFSVRDIAQLNREMGLDEKQLQSFPQVLQMQSFLLIFSIATMGAYLIFLLYTRKFFPRENTYS